VLPSRGTGAHLVLLQKTSLARKGREWLQQTMNINPKQIY
jgi:hypothetical protein